MNQGIILIDPDSKLLLQFMNDEFRRTFIADLMHFPKYKERFLNYVENRGIINYEEIDFIKDPEAQKFIKLEMYVRK